MDNEKYMRRCFELARKGQGSVSPNPLVGSVIVHRGKIIGEGYHKKYGHDHAEVNAIANAEDHKMLKNSTLYVNLEPCSHHGNTPPCADLILKHKIPKVVISTTDPNPDVFGKGIERLENAGVEVVTGVLEEEGKELNKFFLTQHQKGRPFILLKWAQTADGLMGLNENSKSDSRQISGIESQIHVHKLRANMDAILVGVDTVIHDNPSLNTRLVPGSNPLRIVLDPNNRIPSDCSILNDGGPSIIISHCSQTDEAWKKVDASKNGVLPTLLDCLKEHKIQSVLVEGGAKTLKAFIEANLWDEAQVFESQQTWQEGIAAPTLEGAHSQENIGTDTLRIYKNR